MAFSNWGGTKIIYTQYTNTTTVLKRFNISTLSFLSDISGFSILRGAVTDDTQGYLYASQSSADLEIYRLSDFTALWKASFAYISGPLVLSDDDGKLYASYVPPGVPSETVVFDAASDLTRFPHMAGMTFMTVINVNGREITPANIQRKSSDDINCETGLVRGLLEELNFVMGSVHGLEVIKFAKGELIVTLMESGGDHLNISMRLRTRMDNVNATGILGQTWMPLEHRKSNDEFIIR